MFPTQYAMKNSALVTLLFVNPATFELIKLSDSGMLTPNTAPRVMPTIWPVGWFWSSFQISIIPTIDAEQLIIIMRIRVDGMYVATTVDINRKTIWAPPMGICIKRDCSLEYPNPLMIMAENYIPLSSRLEADVVAPFRQELTVVIPPLHRLTHKL